jgi:NADH-quinone oxidoreductase subunit G
VVLAGLEPEEECPILFLRLRKAYRKRHLRVHALAPFRTSGYQKLGATVIPTVPGAEASVLTGDTGVAEALGQPGAVLIVGERLATVPGALSAAAELAGRTGARLAWVPRRAGERGALEAGCLPQLLPGGRSVTEPRARAELAGVWDLEAGILDSRPGRDTDAIVAAAAAGRLGAMVVAGVDPADLADPAAAQRALDRVPFLVSLEIRHSAVSHRADVVLPVAPVVAKAGSFLTWEGRLRPFEAVLPTDAMSDARVLDTLASQLGVNLGCADVRAVRAEMARLPATEAPRPRVPQALPAEPAAPAEGRAILASWHQLLDRGSLLDGEERLAGTARPSVVRVGKELAAHLGAADGDPVTVGTEAGAITLPVEITEMADGVVWLPTNSPGSEVRAALGVTAGALVTVSREAGQ